MDNTLLVFTDGNCKCNGKKNALGGSGVYIPQFDIKLFQKIDNPTNQRAELNAVKMCLEYILNNGFNGKENVLICSDSLYTINCLTNWYINWESNGYIASNKKSVKNKELIKEIIKLKNNLLNNVMVSFKHIRSHQKEPLNKNSKEYMFWKGNFIVDKHINDNLIM